MCRLLHELDPGNSSDVTVPMRSYTNGSPFFACLPSGPAAQPAARTAIVNNNIRMTHIPFQAADFLVGHDS